MRKTKLLAMLGMAMFAGSATASMNSSFPVGSNLTYGGASNPNTIYSTLANPATNGLKIEDNYRIGTGASGGFFVETIGMKNSSDNFDNNIQPLLDIASPTAGDAANLQAAVNNYMAGYDGARINTTGSVVVPILTQFDSMGGGFTIDYTRQYSVTSNLIYNGDLTAGTSGSKYTFTNGDSGLGISYKVLDELAFGYGKKVYESGDGFWTAGGTARIMSLEAATEVIDFGQVLNDNINGNSEVFDYVSDMNDGVTSSAVALDLGVAYNAPNYTFGVVAMNIGSPKFDVRDVSTGTASVDFADNINTSFELKPQVRTNIKWHSKNKHWTLAGSYDLLESNDLNNQDTKWASASVSYATNSAWYIPDVRVGLRDNLSDKQDAYTTAGLTLGMFNLDVASTDFSSLGEEGNNGLYVNAGIEMDF